MTSDTTQNVVISADHDLLVRIETRLDEIERKLNSDWAALHGNGHPGLLDRVTRLESNWKWLQIIACAASGVAGSVITYVLK